MSYNPNTVGIQPNILGLEQAVIGALLLDNKALHKIEHIINTSDFTHQQHQIIFNAIKTQIQGGSPADVVILSNTYNIDLIYLGRIVRDTPSAANIMGYVQKLKELNYQAVTLAHLKKITADLESGVISSADSLQHLIEAQEKTTTRKGNNFMFTQINEMKIAPIDWLIDDFVEAKALVEVFGAPEAGKSLLAIDWGLSVAAGISWQGCNTRQGSVFYIAGEGHNGLSRRFHAWGVNNQVDISDLPFYPSQQAASFYNKNAAIEVEKAITLVVNKTQQTPRLIIIDTLARNFGGNENSTEDMNLFINHIDTHLRDKFKTTVLLIHHTGHGSAERGRGSSALKAAVDAEFSMVKDAKEVINLTCTKMKDAAHPLPRSFVINGIDLTIKDEKGNPSNGAVLTKTEWVEPPKVKTKGLGKNQRNALDVLKDLYAVHQQNFIEQGKDPKEAKVTLLLWQEIAGLDRFRFREVKNGLTDKELIKIDKGFVYLLGDKEAE